MKKHLVLVGGGHAHMVTLSRLHQFIAGGHRVTVIGPSDHHYYSGMGPGMLGQTYDSHQIRFATRKVVEKQGGRFIRDAVSHIDPQKQKVFTRSGATVDYDVLSFNAGSQVSTQMVEGNHSQVYTVKPIEGLRAARDRIISLAARPKVRIAVIGGGAAGVEVAGNAWSLLSRHKVNTIDLKIYSRQKLLHAFPEKVSTAVKTILGRRGIQILEHHPIKGIKNGHIDLKQGKTERPDMIFIATGVRPTAIFAESGLPVGPDGGLRVNALLQCPQYPNIFGGGDCIYFQDEPLEKVGVYAVRQNPVLFENLLASMEDRPLIEFSPGGAYLLIFNLGASAGVFYKKGMIIKGRMAFWIKDLIDKRFMRKFQAKA